MRYRWEYPSFLDGERPFSPTIAEDGETDACVITLEATPHSNLDWSEALDRAEGIPQPILWELRLGLFDQLPMHLSDRGQFQALALSCEQFAEVIWPRFAKRSLGCILYRGNANLPDSLGTDDDWRGWKLDRNCSDGDQTYTLYLRDVAVSYLRLLAERLPAVPLFALLDLEGEGDALHEARLLERREWCGIQPIPRHATSWEPLVWQGEKIVAAPIESVPDAGILLPPLERGVLCHVPRQLLGQPFRWVPEEFLVYEWHGLERLFVHPDAVEASTGRMLQGFQAAGGIIEWLGNGDN